MSLKTLSKTCDIGGVSRELSDEIKEAYIIEDSVLEYKSIITTLYHREGEERKKVGHITFLHTEAPQSIEGLPSDALLIDDIQIFPAYGGKNLKRILICYVACKFSEKGYNEIYTRKRDKLIPYYEEMGFKKEGKMIGAKISDILTYCKTGKIVEKEVKAIKSFGRKGKELIEIINYLLTKYSAREICREIELMMKIRKNLEAHAGRRRKDPLIDDSNL